MPTDRPVLYTLLGLNRAGTLLWGVLIVGGFAAFVVWKVFLPTRVAALVWAVENNDIDLVHLLVESGVDVNGGSGVVTPFGAVIASRNLALMTYLEDHGGTERGR